jgi:mannose/fructose/N-acetylgalactosamine-specific phosphotransferase system component IIB
MNFQLIRIDDRLIHGQVVIGWASHLHTRHIVVCDDSVYENEWEKELYLSTVPDTLSAEILDVDSIVKMSAGNEQDFKQTIMLVNSPQTIAELVAHQFPIKKVNVGGIHFREGRKKYLPYLYLDQDEFNSFRQLAANGIECYCQDMPNSKPIPLESVLNQSI